jgi:hypothetical protein
VGLDQVPPQSVLALELRPAQGALGDAAALAADIVKVNPPAVAVLEDLVANVTNDLSDSRIGVVLADVVAQVALVFVGPAAIVALEPSP